MKEATSPYKGNAELMAGADVEAKFTNPADKIFGEEKETSPGVTYTQEPDKEKPEDTDAAQLAVLQKQLELEKDEGKKEEIQKQITELQKKIAAKLETEK
jgi:hypothetical protein